MNTFRKYVFPAFYGLLIYFTVRLLHDLAVDEQFWKRDWGLNILEMACSVLVGYVCVYTFEKLFRFYDLNSALQSNYQGVFKELALLVIANLIIVCAIFIPMAALTDDGLSWADLADLTIIPTLYALVYYGIARSSSWLKAYVGNRLLLEKITNQQLETELKFLKAQYHPHFLFNALNTVYFQMDEDLPGAKKSIEKFSELLRYQLYDQQQKVPVFKEIAYLESYIDLQKIRTSERLRLELFFDENLTDQLVYPLLFLPLVENAFKFIGGAYKMSVKANVDQKWITFSVENSIPLIANGHLKSGGIGLENLKRRLDLLYGERHELILEKDDKSFKAFIKIDYE